MNTAQILLWSFPIGLSLHVFEEFGFPGGFRQWIKTYNPRKLKSNTIYFIENAAGIVAVCIIALKANDILGYRIYLYCVAGMAGNAASHLRGTIQKKQYCPGTVSSVLLLLPLFVISYWYFLGAGKVDLASATVCLGAGTFIGFYIFGVDIREKDRNKV
jgi:hypothetical protein